MLGFQVKYDDVKTIEKKEAVKSMTQPTTQKGFRNLIGLVNYYRDTWKMKSHTLAPLTKLTSSKVKFKWTEIELKQFKEIRRILNAIMYQVIQISINDLKYIPMIATSNYEQLLAKEKN